MLLSNKEPRPTFRLACDGESVLARLKWPCLTDPQEPHADLLSATRTLVQHSEVSVDLYHVKGHHASSNFGPLTCNATLNIEANQLAWTKLTLYTSSPVNFHIPWSQEVCYMGSHQVKKTLQEPYKVILMDNPQKHTEKNATTCWQEFGIG